mmetsp:Transcript_83374/g.269786  ORF Transcript_83374/g.269786 Transcript_83374/m.269786 type:complete len:251 (+) Transcript_83374:770-1522(+)
MEGDLHVLIGELETGKATVDIALEVSMTDGLAGSLVTADQELQHTIRNGIHMAVVVAALHASPGQEHLHTLGLEVLEHVVVAADVVGAILFQQWQHLSNQQVRGAVVASAVDREMAGDPEEICCTRREPLLEPSPLDICTRLVLGPCQLVAVAVGELAVTVAHELDGVHEENVQAPRLARGGLPSLGEFVVLRREVPPCAAIVSKLRLDAAPVVVVAGDDVELQVAECRLCTVDGLKGLVKARGGTSLHT